MATTLSYGCGWFNAHQAPTGAPSGLNKAATNVLIATMLASVGTGAFMDDLDRWRQCRLNDPVANPFRSPIVEIVAERTPVEDLGRIREVLSPAVSDLANTFGVSRQAVYNWLNGEQPTPEHMAKLRDLAHAADMFAEAGIPVTGALLKRKVIEGKSLFEVTRDGGSAREAAQLFVHIIRRELEQREMMARRFVGRKSLHSVESDFPADNDAR